MRRNYNSKLWGEIITGNYQLVYQWRGKCKNDGDTGVSKNVLTQLYKHKSTNISSKLDFCWFQDNW
jgi:hypothetical protein